MRLNIEYRQFGMRREGTKTRCDVMKRGLLLEARNDLPAEFKLDLQVARVHNLLT